MGEMQKIRTGRHCALVMHVHKFRHGVFTDIHLTRMEERMRSMCADFECELVEFNGENNSDHLLVNFPPKVAVTKLVNSLKGVSSRRLRLGIPPRRKLAAPRPPWSGSTSSSRTGRCEHSPAPPGPAITTLRAAGSEHAVSGFAGPDAAMLRVATIRFASPPG
ncbi:IS200/IS605 family transposase [Streptomyces phaeochromogenes]|uniref:IS200/IS605 family transposase n=1 Tax=Streptomyces phaeochromogenes TaxID=1923 RepID=UPI00386F0132